MALETFAEELSLSIGGLLVSYRILKTIANRQVLSEVIAELNDLNRRFRTDQREFAEVGQRIYYWQTVIGSFMTVMCALIGLPQSLFAIYSEKLYYDHIFPLDTSEYSVAFYLVWAFQSFAVVSCCIWSCLLECVFIDGFVQLSFGHYVLNRKAEELRWQINIDEEGEYKKLIEIIDLSQQLKR